MTTVAERALIWLAPTGTEPPNEPHDPFTDPWLLAGRTTKDGLTGEVDRDGLRLTCWLRDEGDSDSISILHPRQWPCFADPNDRHLLTYMAMAVEWVSGHRWYMSKVMLLDPPVGDLDDLDDLSFDVASVSDEQRGVSEGVVEVTTSRGITLTGSESLVLSDMWCSVCMNRSD